MIVQFSAVLKKIEMDGFQFNKSQPTKRKN